MYAAYGGVFIVLSIIWGWKVDGVSPDRFDVFGGLLSLIGVAIIMVTAIVIARFTPLKAFLTAERLGQLLKTAGPWAPAAYIVAYAAGVCLFMPGTLLATVGAAIFGPYYGFIYVWLGAMIGAVLAFFIGRYLGRDFAASLIGNKLGKYDEAIERNGFATVLYLRLVYFPFLLYSENNRKVESMAANRSCIKDCRQ